MNAAPISRRSWLATADQTLQNLPGAVLILFCDGTVEYANGAARALFKTLDPIGSTLRSLFSLNGMVGGGEMLAAVAAGTSVSTRLPDGRVFDVSSRPLPDDKAVVTLMDVSRYVHDAERATRDALTGLFNRASFHQLLREKLVVAQRTGEALAVLCIDLDRFKSVNDTLGHPVGDGLLAKVGERLRSMSRETDFVARLGGDEFGILQTGGDQPLAAQAMATRLVDLIGRTYVVDGHMLNIGASVGIALAPGDSSNPEVLLKRADLALYKAKVDGRGTFRFFEGEMDARMQARRAMEINIRKAMALKELELVYQPQVHLETNAVVGFEALLRWNNAERGVVSPADFIPLAEEIGLIVPIGDWVLRTACHEAASWSQPVSIAVNLSPVQFRNAKLIESVVSALASSGLDPGRLELEITEGALLENTERVLSVLNALRAIGVRISMDDFGTGYSSLSYLQKFPFDKIKIDQSFVRGNTDDSNAIVRAVAGLGASLGIRTTAEGVETVEQLNRIRAQGCHEVQGYFTGRPMAATAAASLLNATSSH
ncbi:EAL domain-containing protein [Sphingomonas solaris]|uniref:EAL domain-containing protein n=1 Tax=Alterirhizorhabdus solaris TaxID=2529389 RepID=A0A558QWE6_9SPHN|nr:EAL domain-containing protein [Sphingomonas solaris]TVV71402.1 EAL domain-containing protein [Sphingomonas solaris]